MQSQLPIDFEISQDEMEIQRIGREIVRVDTILRSFAQSDDNTHERLVYTFIDKMYKNILKDGRTPKGTIEDHAALIRTAIERVIKELKITELVILVYDSRNTEYNSSPDFDAALIRLAAARLRRASQRKDQKALIIPVKSLGIISGDYEDVAFSLTQSVRSNNIIPYIENIKKLTLASHWSRYTPRQRNESTSKYLSKMLVNFPHVTTVYLDGCSTACRTKPDLLLTNDNLITGQDEKSQDVSQLFKDKEIITSHMDKDILDKAGLTEVEQIFLETYGMARKDVEHECRLILQKLTNKTPLEVDNMTTKQRMQEVLKIFSSMSAKISDVLGKEINFPIELCLLEELNDTKNLAKEYHSARRLIALGPEERKFYKIALPMLKTQIKELPEDDHDSLAAVLTHTLEKQPWMLGRTNMFIKGHLFDIHISSRTVTEGDETSDSMRLHGCKIKYPVNPNKHVKR